MTLKEFARLAGYSFKYASQIELGHGNAGPKYLTEAARLFKCEITDISTERKPKPRKRRRTPVRRTAAAENGARA